MRIGIIGRTADGAQLFDGQTIKTRVLRDELYRYVPGCEITCVDTYNYKKRAVQTLSNTIKVLKESDCVFVLLSRNGCAVFFPILHWFNKIFKKPIYHDVIGGCFDEVMRSHPSWKKYINAFRVNWVELPSLERKLQDAGIRNAVTLPNFKRLPILRADELSLNVPEVFEFCTFSRVVKTKGIVEAAEAVNYANAKAGKRIARLHVYGEIDESFREQFEALLENNKETVIYEGIAAPEKSVENICKYFALLFPTTHPGEGFPGTFIDAFAAGVPIIASDWNYNAELIDEGVTGYCYPVSEPRMLNELVWNACRTPEMVLNLKENCIKKAEQYSPDYVMGVICRQMREDGVLKTSEAESIV